MGGAEKEKKRIRLVDTDQTLSIYVSSKKVSYTVYAHDRARVRVM